MTGTRSPLCRTLRSPLGLVTGVLLVVLAAVVLLAPVLLRTQADRMSVSAIQQGMSARHWFGTDNLGRDIFARTLVASRQSVLLALATTACATVFGITLGMLPVVLGRRPGRLLVAGINLLVAFPGLLIALFLSMVFGVGAGGAVLALALALTPGFARLTHTSASAVSGAEYVSAARLLGVPWWRILLRHVLPNIVEPLVVNATTIVGTALLALSALSYLGFGVQAPSFDWGKMLSEGLNDIYSNPAAALLPAGAVVVAGVTFILAGEVAAQAIAASGGNGAAPARASAAAQADGETRSADGARGDADEHPGAATDAVLRVEALRVRFPQRATDSVHGVSFALRAGEIVGIVGESGSGKSLTGAALGMLVPHPGTVTASRLELRGSDLQGIPREERDKLLGTSLATVFQNPMSAMNPAVRVGLQLAEVSQVHQRMSRGQAMARAVGRLTEVGLGDPHDRIRQYPQAFSGGMRQRAVIAMSLMAEPAVIVADEPTTALDTTVQGQVLDLLRAAADDRGAAVVFISHDIAVVAQIASRVLVMYAGRIVEELPVTALADQGAHPYTRALVASVPDLATDRSRPLATIEGRPPEPEDTPVGCAFADRCPKADDLCRTRRPDLVPLAPGRRVACWKPHLDIAETMADRLGAEQ